MPTRSRVLSNWPRMNQHEQRAALYTTCARPNNAPAALYTAHPPTYTPNPRFADQIMNTILHDHNNLCPSPWKTDPPRPTFPLTPS